MNILNKISSLFSAGKSVNTEDEASKTKDEEETPMNTNRDKEKQNSHNQKERTEKMEGKAKIYNLIIVDESGSMSHLRKATLSGINETINSIRNAQEEFENTQFHTLTLVTFDSGSNRPNVRTMIDDQPITTIKEFKE